MQFLARLTVVADIEQSDACPLITRNEVNECSSESRAIREHIDGEVLVTGGAWFWLVATSLDVRQLDGCTQRSQIGA